MKVIAPARGGPSAPQRMVQGLAQPVATHVFEPIGDDEAVPPGAPRVTRNEPHGGSVRCE